MEASLRFQVSEQEMSAWAEPGHADALCWVFGSSRPLSAADPWISGHLDRFLSQWQSHGMPVAGRWRILFDRFLVVLLEGPGGDAAGVSGCSQDSLKGEIAQLEAVLETQMLDSSRVFYRGPDGRVEAVGRADFKRLAREGVITPDTEVFDLSVARVGDLRSGAFAKPLRESAYARLYEIALRTQQG